MDTRAIAQEYRLAHWAQVMRDHRESSLTIKAFCAEAGFHENTYYYWQRKLRQAACDHLAAIEPSTVQASPTVFGFAEIQVIESEAALLETLDKGQLRIDVAGMQITADNSYPTEKLAQLLRALVQP